MIIIFLYLQFAKLDIIDKIFLSFGMHYYEKQLNMYNKYNNMNFFDKNITIQTQYKFLVRF